MICKGLNVQGSERIKYKFLSFPAYYFKNQTHTKFAASNFKVTEKLGIKHPDLDQKTIRQNFVKLCIGLNEALVNQF